MSLSYPERYRQACFRQILLVAFVLASAVVVTPGQAAQTYWQPRLETRVEQNSNRNLSTNPDEEADVTGYIASAEVLWGYLTPTTDTQFRPRLRFQRYPDQKDIQRSEQFVDFSTRHFTTERTALALVARYARQDAFNAELGAAEFDDFDPEDPTEGGAEGGESSAVIGKDTRTRTQFRPGFTHEFSELTGIAIGGLFETVRFDSDVVDRTDYDFAALSTLITRRLTPRTRLLTGPMVSRYETRDNRNQTDAYGLDLAVEHEWSEVSQFGAGFFVRRSDIELSDGVTTESDSDTNFGLDIHYLRRTELGRIRLSAGRALRPTSTGNMVVSDQLRIQYDHDFSQRLSMRTAARAYSQESQGSFETRNDRDYARAEVGLTWMLTPTMYVGGGYEYTWREISRETTSADNHAVYVSFGYRGLGRPR